MYDYTPIRFSQMAPDRNKGAYMCSVKQMVYEHPKTGIQVKVNLIENIGLIDKQNSFLETDCGQTVEPCADCGSDYRHVNIHTASGKIKLERIL